MQNLKEKNVTMLSQDNMIFQWGGLTRNISIPSLQVFQFTFLALAQYQPAVWFLL